MAQPLLWRNQMTVAGRIHLWTIHIVRPFASPETVRIRAGLFIVWRHYMHLFLSRTVKPLQNAAVSIHNNANRKLPRKIFLTYLLTACNTVLHSFIHSLIHVFTSIYPFTGASQGCGESRNIIHKISVELQMS